ncbi:MAG: DMT family transporter [Alphaproteobacteria bacterium]|nr:DMT family transporter [Alphaproteobacteria bacterium]HPF47162.1 EamA family transporter [Emcibacteraceae bacterium]HRW29991.1 EamA family transporter [Emcibacteraceae bacterium]
MEFYIIEALLGALMFGIGGLLFKWNAHNNGDEVYYFAGLYSVGALCFLVEGFDEIGVAKNLIYHFMALLVGLGSAGGNFAFSHGLRRGPAGLSAAFAKANIIIVILISALYYGEILGPIEFLGIGSFLAAMVVVNLNLGKNRRPANRAWFLIMLVCMVLIAFRNGGLKVANEMGLSSPVILTLAYGYCALFFMISIIRKNKNPWSGKVSKVKVMVVGGFTGTVSYAGLYFYVNALKSGPGSIVVTIFSLDMFFLLLMSYLFFGERLNLNQKLGFLLSAAGFILIGIG